MIELLAGTTYAHRLTVVQSGLDPRNGGDWLCRVMMQGTDGADFAEALMARRLLRRMLKAAVLALPAPGTSTHRTVQELGGLDIIKPAPGVWRADRWIVDATFAGDVIVELARGEAIGRIVLDAGAFSEFFSFACTAYGGDAADVFDLEVA